MKAIDSAALAALVLAGCATAKPIQGPNARTAHVIKCANPMIDACYEKAAEVCPTGYTMLDRHNSPSGVLVPVGKATTYSAGPNTLLVECKSPS